MLVVSIILGLELDCGDIVHIYLLYDWLHPKVKVWHIVLLVILLDVLVVLFPQVALRLLRAWLRNVLDNLLIDGRSETKQLLELELFFQLQFQHFLSC